MSQTLFVDFRCQSRENGTGGFWAFDVLAGVFLKHLVDVATSHLRNRNEAWLAEAVEHWRFNAVCGDCGLFLEDSWSAEQVTAFTHLARKACDILSQRDQISAEEMESWQLIDGNDGGRFARGLPFVTTASAIRLGEAIIQLVNDALPEPPPGTWWFLGTEEGPVTMGKRGE